MNVLFFGTPATAVPFIDWLRQNTTLTGAVCRADKPAGRGHEETAPPVKQYAQENGIPVFQPVGPWNDAAIGPLRDANADIGIVVAYGRILPKTVYALPKHGCLNIHFSLLPAYRGAAPIQWSLINGEKKTGVTAFWLDDGLDSGPICHQEEMAVDPDDNALTLREKLIPVGLYVLEQVFEKLARGEAPRTPQTGTGPIAAMLTKDLGRVRWVEKAASIVNLVRGVYEWPGASTVYRTPDGSEKILKIQKASALAAVGKAAPGTVVEAVKDQGIVVNAGDGAVLLREVQPEGKRPMSAWAFWQGARLAVGDRLG